jgi:hypothetical protein
MILILSVLEIRYGLNNENVSPELLDAIFESCINFHENLTVEDLKNCFNHAKIEKKQFQKITLDEFLEPIRAYIQVKQVARQAIIDLQNENEKEQNEKQKEIDFYNQARELYKESLKGGEWLGDMFQARVIARGFWDALYLDEREGLKMIATDEVNELKIKAIDNALILVYDPKFYLAHEVIKYSVRQQKKFIEL